MRMVLMVDQAPPPVDNSKEFSARPASFSFEKSKVKNIAVSPRGALSLGGGVGFQINKGILGNKHARSGARAPKQVRDLNK